MPPWLGGVHPPAEVIIEGHIVDRIEYDILDDGRVTVSGVRGAGRRIMDELTAAGYAVVHPNNAEHRKVVREMMKQEMDHAKRYADNREARRRNTQGGREGSVS